MFPGGSRRVPWQFGIYPLDLRFVAENSCQRVRDFLFEKRARAAISRAIFSVEIHSFPASGRTVHEITGLGTYPTAPIFGGSSVPGERRAR